MYYEFYFLNREAKRNLANLSKAMFHSQDISLLGGKQKIFLLTVFLLQPGFPQCIIYFVQKYGGAIDGFLVEII